MDLRPIATQVGQTTEHTVSSRYDLFGAYEVLVSGEGVTGEVVAEDPAKVKPPVTALKVKFKVEAGALPGVRDFRIATPRGVSTLGQLVVGMDPVVQEAKSNNTMALAQEVKLPTTFCGAIETAEDVDYFKFQAAAGQSLVFHVRCARLQDRIHDLQTHADPIITLKNSAGVDLAQVDNYFFADPLLHYQFKQAGEYYLEIRDLRYQGNAYWQYSVEVNDRPFVTTVFPMQVTPGQATDVELVGFNLPADLRGQISLPADQVEGVTWAVPKMGDAVGTPVWVVASSLTTTVEGEAPNGTLETAQAVSVPGCVNGRISQVAELDCYRFEAKKGDRLTFEVLARRYQSALDPNLRIMDSKGKQLAENDDMKYGKHSYADSLLENWLAPADGTYTLEVRDLQLRGGADFVYALKITKAEPEFQLQLDTDKSIISAGTAAPLYVRVYRKNGFEGEVQLAVDGLPEGVTAECGKILAKHDDGVILFYAPAGAKLAAANVHISGTALLPAAEGEEPRALLAVAEPLQEIYMPGGGRGHFPADLHTVSVTEPMDIRKVSIEPREVSLKPGESVKINVTLERAEGFDKNVTLDVRYRHLNSVYGDSLPKGLTMDAKQSKSLINGKTLQGHVTLTAAKDAAPVERQLIPVMAQVSINFVMKTSYAAEPLYVTILPPDAKTASK